MTTRWIHNLALLAALCLGCANPVCAGVERDYLQAAFATQDKMQRQSSEVRIKRGASESTHFVARVLPDRVHAVITNPQGGRTEFIIIGSEQFQHRDGVWRRLPEQRGPVPRIDFGSLLNGLNTLAESSGNSDRRTFKGSIAWGGADGSNSGDVIIEIDRKTQLPAIVTFAGTCAGKPCSFEQAFRYDATISIKRPAVP
jgi:hypothetical protein